MTDNRLSMLYACSPVPPARGCATSLISGDTLLISGGKNGLPNPKKLRVWSFNLRTSIWSCVDHPRGELQCPDVLHTFTALSVQGKQIGILIFGGEKFVSDSKHAESENNTNALLPVAVMLNQ